MKYIKLFESFSSNIEENLESLLVDLTDNGFGYETHFNNNKEDYFSVEIYKGDISPNQRQPFDYENPNDEADFEVSEVRDEVLYLVEYMLDKLGPKYGCDYELETRWNQYTVNSIVDGDAEYDAVIEDLEDSDEYLDMISLTIRFFLKPS